MMVRKQFAHFKKLIMVVALVAAAAPMARSEAPAAPEPVSQFTAKLSSSQVSDGSLVLLSIEASPSFEKSLGGAFTDVVSGKFQGTTFYFYKAESSSPLSVYQAILGIPYNIKSGQYPITIHWTERGLAHTREVPVQVVDGKYASETLKVDSRHVNPGKRDMIRIKNDIAEVGKIYSTVSRNKLWNGPFKYPVKSRITSVFGTKRVFNGHFASFHTGLDMKATFGTPVYAPATGVVVLAKSLFFTGNTVMLDHGFGLVTLYAHLSKIKVKKGQLVQTGKLLGLAGMTGRANGPHLHWQVIVNKIKVNPMGLIDVLK